MLLPVPSFYSKENAAGVFVERAARVADEAEAFRARHRIAPSKSDRIRVCAFGIDCQIGFCTPGASLFVPGAVEDTHRAACWIYGHLDRITTLLFSMDTHRVYQVFHPAWWVDAEGNHPAPYTSISHEEVRSGRWIPVGHLDEALEYTKKLEAGGKHVLTVWPYHALLGGVSHALVPALMECAIFHSIARREPTLFETKGAHPLTENYSVLSPEVTELRGTSVGAFNAALFRSLVAFDRVYVFGQAKSHCVLSTLFDLRDQLKAADPACLSKIWILEDAMSPVPPPPIDPLPPALDFPAIAARALDELRREGMHVVRTTDPMDV